MGGRTLEAMALIGIGIRRLSITPVAVGPVKAMIRSLDGKACEAALGRLLKHPPEDFRGALTKWAESHGVSIG
jgi:phosphotransferase system enzyme I (PtsP)